MTQRQLRNARNAVPVKTHAAGKKLIEKNTKIFMAKEFSNQNFATQKFSNLINIRLQNKGVRLRMYL